MKICCDNAMVETKKGFYCALCGKQELKPKKTSIDYDIKARIASDNFDLQNNRSL